jgi:hypothetical protein
VFFCVHDNMVKIARMVMSVGAFTLVGGRRTCCCYYHSCCLLLSLSSSCGRFLPSVRDCSYFDNRRFSKWQLPLVTTTYHSHRQLSHSTTSRSSQQQPSCLLVDDDDDDDDDDDEKKGDTKNNLPPPNRRAILLNQKLDAIIQSPVASTEIMNAALRPMQDPMVGFDQRFGRSALRAYQAFVFPKTTTSTSKKQSVLFNSKINQNCDHNNDEVDIDLSVLTNIQLEAAAGRFARQIEFLIKRHQSHQTEWIRHHDDATVATLSFYNSNHNDNTPSIIQPNSQEDIYQQSRSSKRLFPIILVLDNLRSALNVGSLYRTAETCACQAVLTCGITPHPNGNGAEKIRKSALGSE